jgi:hypothetical protein
MWPSLLLLSVLHQVMWEWFSMLTVYEMGTVFVATYEKGVLRDEMV